jgi:hypothetical protein
MSHGLVSAPGSGAAQSRRAARTPGSGPNHVKTGKAVSEGADHCDAPHKYLNQLYRLMGPVIIGLRGLRPCDLVRCVADVGVGKGVRCARTGGVWGLMTLIWKRVSVTVVAVVVVIVASIALSYQHGQRHIVAAADEFRIPQDWVLLSQRVQSPDLVCFGRVACPSLMRQWRAPKDLATSDFYTLIASSGWDLKRRDNCEPRPGVLFGRSCKAEGKIAGHKAQVFYESSNANPAIGTLTLFLE